MKVSNRRCGDVAILDIDGPIAGRKAAETMAAMIRTFCHEGPRHVVASLADVPSVDLAGLGALVDAHMALRRVNGTFKLACVTKRLHDLVVVTRLLTVFDTYDSVEEAVGETGAGLRTNAGSAAVAAGVGDGSALSAPSLAVVS